MDLYFFDCDKTLYEYDFTKRLPALSSTTGLSQYHLASTWWVGGYEHAAEAGEYTTTPDYLAAFNRVTGAQLTRDQWVFSRKSAMTPIPEAIDTLRWASARGTTSLLSNNPIPFHDCIESLAPEAHPLLQGNDLVSAMLGARKPDGMLYTRALERFDARASDAILIDDSEENVRAAIAAGMHGFWLRSIDGTYDIGGLHNALNAFATR